MKKLFVFLLIIFLSKNFCFSTIGSLTSPVENNEKALKKLEKQLEKKAKKEEKKKKKEEKRRLKQEKKRMAPRMVETRDEWLYYATSKDRLHRDSIYKEPDKYKNLNPINEPNMYFVKYNNPPGEREINLALIKKRKFLHSMGVATEDFKRLAYVEYSFNSEYNQVSSELFILPLNQDESRLERMRRPNLNLADREFTYTSGKQELKKNIFSAFTIVDWKSDGSALLLKEKTGSLETGLFRTIPVIVYFDENGLVGAYQLFSSLENKIRAYWEEEKKIALNFYRWDIKPLGWSADNQNEVISLAYAYTKDNKKSFLGAWALDYITGDVRLLSLDKTEFNITISGLCVKSELDR